VREACAKPVLYPKTTLCTKDVDFGGNDGVIVLNAFKVLNTH
jgi:hypothetical protein